MKRDEVKSRAGLSSRVVSLVRAMIEKNAQEFSSLRRSRAGGIRAANAGFGKRSQNGIGRVVVEFEEFLVSALPVSDIGFIPDFPQPGFYFRVAVALAKMPYILKNIFMPLCIVVRWL